MPQAIPPPHPAYYYEPPRFMPPAIPPPHHETPRFMPPAIPPPHPAYYYAALWNYHHPVPPPAVQRLTTAPSLPSSETNGKGS